MSKKVVVSIWLVVLAGLIILSVGLWYQSGNASKDEQLVFTDDSVRTVIANLNNYTYELMLSDTPQLRSQGLSGQQDLGESEGMLFVFDDDGLHGFWMKDMNFAIDIIWIDKNYRVVSIEPRVSPSSFPNVYQPTAPARYVIEITSGHADAIGLKPGDIVNFTF